MFRDQTITLSWQVSYSKLSKLKVLSTQLRKNSQSESVKLKRRLCYSGKMMTTIAIKFSQALQFNFSKILKKLTSTSLISIDFKETYLASLNASAYFTKLIMRLNSLRLNERNSFRKEFMCLFYIVKINENKE